MVAFAAGSMLKKINVPQIAHETDVVFKNRDMQRTAQSDPYDSNVLNAVANLNGVFMDAYYLAATLTWLIEQMPRFNLLFRGWHFFFCSSLQQSMREDINRSRHIHNHGAQFR